MLVKYSRQSREWNFWGKHLVPCRDLDWSGALLSGAEMFACQCLQHGILLRPGGGRAPSLRRLSRRGRIWEKIVEQMD